MSEGTQQTSGTLRRAEERIEETVGGPARLKIIALLSGVLALDTADKGTVSAVASSLQHAFGIGFTKIGLLIAAVSFVGAVFALPMGVLVDRTRRKRLLIAVISIWSAAMVLSGTASSFPYLLATRIFLGAVTAAATPTVASLTGDFFPARERARIYGLILAGELVGMGAGFLISGEASSLLDWRWSFYLMGLPGAALAWAIWRHLPEPARGGQSWIEWGQRDICSEEDMDEQGVEDEQTSEPEGAAEHEQAPEDEPAADHGQRAEVEPAPEDEQIPEAAQAQAAMLSGGVRPREQLVLHEDPSRKSLWWAIAYVVRIPTYLLIILASSLGYFFFSGVRGFGMIYLTGHYGISRSVASALVIVLGVGALTGVVAGGRLSSLLLDRKRFDARILVPGAALFLSVLLFAPGIWTRNVFFGVALLTLGATALAAANPPIDAARLDIVHPRLWGRAESGRMALRATLEGAAPILFGLVTGWFGGGDRGLEMTYLVMLLPVAAAALLAIPARRTYPRDVATAAASLETTGPAGPAG